MKFGKSIGKGTSKKEALLSAIGNIPAVKNRVINDRYQRQGKNIKCILTYITPRSNLLLGKLLKPALDTKFNKKSF